MAFQVQVVRRYIGDDLASRARGDTRVASQEFYDECASGACDRRHADPRKRGYITVCD
jgi:hypothetical protein